MVLQKQNWAAPLIGLMLIAILLFVAGLSFHRLWRKSEEAVAEELAKFDRLRSIAAFQQTLDGSGPTSDDKAYDGLFLTPGPAAIVSAALLAQIKQIAAARGVEIVRGGDLPPKTEGAITLVGGSLQMSGTIPAIYDLVQQIEAARPMLFVDRLIMRSNGAGMDEDKNDTVLTAEMHIYGAVRSSSVSATQTGTP